jgi:hypothetical protein
MRDLLRRRVQNGISALEEVRDVVSCPDFIREVGQVA